MPSSPNLAGYWAGSRPRNLHTTAGVARRAYKHSLGSLLGQLQSLALSKYVPLAGILGKVSC